MKKIGIYVHFPFCVQKCNYCNFNSYANKSELQLDYFQALLREIEMYSDSKKIQIDSIFIGGGTPSAMFDGCISTVLSHIRKNFVLTQDCEITVEANPNSLSVTKCREWKESGVNRVSVGLQTTNPNALKIIGRVHGKKEYCDAITNLQSVGINNINTDCLIGLPRQKLSDVRRTLELVTKLGCSHISVYSLILEEDTPLYDMVRSGVVKLPKEEKTLGMYNFALKFLKEKGLVRYEVSNFARPGYECRHNMNTWRMHEYLGFGAGAHSYYDNVRYSNVENIEDYIYLITNKKVPVECREKLSKQEKVEETIMLGLRTTEGIDIADIKKTYGIDLRLVKKKQIENLLSLGLIKVVYDKISATDLGFTVLNKIIVELV